MCCSVQGENEAVMMGLIVAAVLHSTAWRLEQLRLRRLPSRQDDGALGYQAGSLRLLTVKHYTAGCRSKQNR